MDIKYRLENIKGMDCLRDPNVDSNNMEMSLKETAYERTNRTVSSGLL
jgi:hypothetical protein